jgi:hypothetical protein
LTPAAGHPPSTWLAVDRGKREEAEDCLRRAIVDYQASGTAPDAKVVSSPLAA